MGLVIFELIEICGEGLVIGDGVGEDWVFLGYKVVLRLFNCVIELLVSCGVLLIFFDICGGIIGLIVVVGDGNWLGDGLMLFRVFKFKFINLIEVKLGEFGKGCLFVFGRLLVFFWVEEFFNRWFKFKFRLFRFDGLRIIWFKVV